MLKSPLWSNRVDPNRPDYLGLVQFLVSPLLEFPDSLSIDCEQANNNQRVWIRLAFEETDKGRVFGRGGRNVQAILKVLQLAAIAAGQSLYLDVYQSPDGDFQETRQSRYGGGERKFVRKKTRSSSSSSRPAAPAPKLSVRSRWEQ
ncbi:RNA-binding protein (contains KH domain)-like protein [Rippkaea orientalis PCC 8801]|uniref:RNA-binding protein (Contains KH domain)-like protein n=1 Tax=Rippkaea orientalis (strain PCC 8801 / RF-1) TaxID=41431 RepID=B7JY29_RIPO1|nr:KH domain-containing protein [Rippkaea orientalis]ACK65993.1 RNA-binding protein (contains KH domain)-like protein [Rippkaea orientalis PCC 8801]